MYFCWGINDHGRASEVSALKCTLIRFAPSTGTNRSGVNRPFPVTGVPANPVAEQNARYSGTAAYERPSDIRIMDVEYSNNERFLSRNKRSCAFQLLEFVE